jgi:signal transduction histidine kinase
MPGIGRQPPDQPGEVEHSGALGMDLLDRLGWLCDAFRAQSGIDCRLEVRDEHARLDPAAGAVLYRTVRELFVLCRRARTRRIVVASELRDDGSVAFHVKCGPKRANTGTSSVEGDVVALWDIDQRLREVDAYLELGDDAGVCPTVVFPQQLFGGRRGRRR